MAEFRTEEITVLLNRIANGEQEAEERLYDLTFEELRSIAQGQMKHEKAGTLQSTALVNEAYARLKGDMSFQNAPNRKYFFASVARAMRYILIDAARRRQSLKQGGNWIKQPIDQVVAYYEERSVDLIDLDEALDELERLNPEQARVVHLKWLSGMTIKEVAELLEISEWKVEEDWRIARAFLFKRLRQDG